MRYLRALLIIFFALIAIGFGRLGCARALVQGAVSTTLRHCTLRALDRRDARRAGGLVAGRRRYALGVAAVAIAALLAWWSTLLPSNARDWAPDVARTVRGAVTGDTLILTDVRDFQWRSESDFTPRWETRSYDLSKLASVDLIADYWAGEAVAHTLVSFGFSDGRFLTWSIELRKVRGQAWSALAGFFRDSELVTLAGDERDLIRLRTKVRGEDLRIYRLNAARLCRGGQRPRR